MSLTLCKYYLMFGFGFSFPVIVFSKEKSLSSANTRPLYCVFQTDRGCACGDGGWSGFLITDRMVVEC